MKKQKKDFSQKFSNKINKNTYLGKKTPTISEIEAKKALNFNESKYIGLNHEQVEEQLEIHGKNEVDRQRFVFLKKTFKAIINPFILILIVLGAIGFFKYFVYSGADRDIEDLATGIIVSSMVVISLALTLFQDVRSWNSTKKLQDLVKVTTSVYRHNSQHPISKEFIDINEVSRNTKEILIKEVVPGDIVYLSSGDMVPADGIILNSQELFTNESSLTGESLPIEKHKYLGDFENNKVIPKNNIVFMGSSVVSGSAVVLIVKTGKKTAFGSIASALVKTKVKTSFDRGINKLTYVLLAFMAVIIPILFIVKAIYGGWNQTNILNSLKWSAAVAVALTPEMLPMVVTGNLARGAIKMSKNKVIVKNLNVMQSFGAMDILCTDKTGTLTEDEIELINYLDLSGKESDKILEYSYLNSFYQTGLKNNIDKTIIQFALNKKNNKKFKNPDYIKVDELPFDFSRRRMSVVVKNFKNKEIIITKGAIEEILKISKKAEIKGKVVELTQEIKKEVLNLSRKMNKKGLRVIAVSYSEHKDKERYDISDEKDMVLLGFLGFHDIPKKTAVQAIESLQKKGVEVKILTGDNEIVTKAICKKVGLDPKIPVLGDEIDNLSDSELQKLVLKTVIFAKVNPLQKARIVSVLKRAKKTVGFLGDGINDAVALKIADVGISVDSANDIAKEASDIIMLEKSLRVLEKGVIGGRKTFLNILKYTKNTFASNFGNALSMTIAVFWFPQLLPLTGLQILVQNLLYDFSQLSTPWDNVDKEMLRKPKNWEPKSFIPFALWNGPISSLFDITTFAIMGHYFNCFDSNNVALFQTGWFVVGVTTQILIFHLIRTEKVSFIQSNASLSIYVIGIIILAFGMSLPYIPVLGQNLGFVPLPPLYFAFWGAIVVGYGLLTQLVKMAYKKVYKSWL